MGTHRPLSRLGVMLVLYRGKPIFVELKGRGGVASKAPSPSGNAAGIGLDIRDGTFNLNSELIAPFLPR
jgi:hypothetical protein